MNRMNGQFDKLLDNEWVIEELTIDIKHIVLFPPCLFFNCYTAYICNIDTIWYFIIYIDRILLINKEPFL